MICSNQNFDANFFYVIYVQGHADDKLKNACGSPRTEKSDKSFKNTNKISDYLERFVAQAIKLSSNIDHDYPHKYGSSYKRVSMMSFKNIHIDLSTLKKFDASYGGFQYGKNDSKLVAQAITFLSDLEINHPHKCGSNYKRLSMMSFENIHIDLGTLKTFNASYDALQCGKNDSKLVAQAITLLSDVEINHPHKCGSNYKRLSMMSFENIQLYLSTLKKCGLSNDTLK